MPKFSRFSLLITLVLLLSGCSFSLVSDITPPPGSELAASQSTQPVVSSPVFPIVPPDLADGKKLYNQDCTQCHGVTGLGDGPQAAQLSAPVASLGLSDFARQFSPAEWFTVVTQGNMEKFMPAFPNLTDRQRWDVVSYAMSLSTSPATISQGKALYEAKCADCHGLSGRGDGKTASTLTSQPADLTKQSFMAQVASTSLYQSITEGISPDMPAYTNTLDDSQRWSLVSYIRSFTVSGVSAEGNTAPKASVTGQVTAATYPGPAYPYPMTTLLPQITSTPEITPTGTFTGSVTVQLLNGSGGETPSDAPVTLYGFDNMQNT